MKSFSVLLSIYQKENASYFDLALNSIFMNSLIPSEVVIVVDGPLTEHLQAILSKYEHDYPDIIKTVKLVTNMGLSHALNVGLETCTNEFVARMDTDDICLKTRFEKQFNFLLENKQIDILGSTAIQIDKDGMEMNLWKVPLHDEQIKKYIWTCPFIHPSVMFKRSSILRIGGYNVKAGPRQDDYELWIRSAINGLHLANLPEPLLKYRFFSDNLKKNNYKVGWYTMKNGFKACNKLDLGFKARLGVCYPFVRALLPTNIAEYLNKKIAKFNPRNDDTKNNI